MMQFIDLQSQYQAYKSEIQTEINSILDGSAYIMGKTLHDFESSLSEFTKVKHAIGCSSGTDALLLALLSLEIEPGDEIIVPAFSFFATVGPISLLGGKPIFVDIEADSFNIDVSKIEPKITKKTKAIIPVSLYGQVSDMDEINDLAQQYKLTVIEDGAQSFGAMYSGKKTKDKMSGNLSDFGCTSFFPAKPLGAYGDGGAIFTNDDDRADKLRMFLNHGSKERHVHEHIGINGRLDSLQAGILGVKLKYFLDECKKRTHLANRYNEALKKSNYVTPMIKKGRTSVYAQYTVRIKNLSKTKTREQVVNHLSKREIPIAIHYPSPLYKQPVYQHLKIDPSHYPVSEMIASEVISLPMSAFLKESDQDKVISALLSI